MSDNENGENTFQGKVTKRHVTFRVNDAESEALRDLSSKLNTKDSNIIRRGIRKVAEEAGIELPEGVFTDKPGGNWLPKPKGKDDRLTTINDQPVLIPGY